MKTPMSMQRMMDKVGVTIIEEFGVFTAIDNQDSSWQLDANCWDEADCQRMMEDLSTIHQTRCAKPKKNLECLDMIEGYLLSLEGAKK